MPPDPAVPPTDVENDPGGRTARQIVVLALLAALIVVLYRLAPPHNYFDLRIYMKAMRWWADGHPLYDYAQSDRVQGELFFTYPPFAALLLRPFAVLPLGVTIAIFVILTLVGFVVTTWWLVIPVTDRHGVPRWFATALSLLLVLAVESTRETITFGQINMLLVVLVLADLLFAVPRGSRWAGVGIGVATAIKLFPGIFILYLLATRRWRAAIAASAAAAGATLLALAVAPGDSWRFWTHELWATGRVGRTDYTGNQSLLGLLSRLSAPEAPNRLVWLVLVAIVAGFGLWRAVRVTRAGDPVAGLALTGLVGALVSPITWPHHVYWFIPAVVVLVDSAWPVPAGTASAEVGRRRRRALLALTIVLYVCISFGVVSYYDWGVRPQTTDSPVEFVFRNTYVLLALLLLVALPARGGLRRSGVQVTPTPRAAPAGDRSSCGEGEPSGEPAGGTQS